MSIRRLQTSLSLLVVLVLLALVASPAGAAQKVFEDRQTNFSEDLLDVFGGLPGEICGVEGPFDADSYLRSGVENWIAWDNGRFQLTQTNSVRLYKDGQLILRDRFTFHQVFGPGEVPIEEGDVDPRVMSLGIGIISHCTQASETPGLLYRAHQSVTRDRHGNVTVRGDACDPNLYFFC